MHGATIKIFAETIKRGRNMSIKP